jgi:hypothetical protein
MPTIKECPKCKGKMQPGILASMQFDSTEMGWQADGEEDAYELEVYRCKKCGFLEFYAPEPEEEE